MNNKIKLFIMLLFVLIFIIINMAKPKDLSPKFKIPITEKELQLQMGQIPMGSKQGGLGLFSNKFKRGYGNRVFGSDENGIWLGAAEFADAPFSVDMLGALISSLITIKNDDGNTVIDSTGLVSSTSFLSDTVVLGSQITRSASGWGDASGLEVTIDVPRDDVKVLLIATLSGKNTNAYKEGEQLIRFDVDGTPTGVYDLSGRVITHSAGGGGYNDPPSVGINSATIHHFVSLSEGEHTIKIQHRWSVLGNAILIGTSGTEIAGCRLSYLILGS